MIALLLGYALTCTDPCFKYDAWSSCMSKTAPYKKNLNLTFVMFFSQLFFIAMFSSLLVRYVGILYQKLNFCFRKYWFLANFWSNWQLHEQRKMFSWKTGKTNKKIILIYKYWKKNPRWLVHLTYFQL